LSLAGLFIHLQNENATVGASDATDKAQYSGRRPGRITAVRRLESILMEIHGISAQQLPKTCCDVNEASMTLQMDVPRFFVDN
jgi:hypothetical protein